MTHLWTSKQAVKATGGKTSRDWSATGISIDTRSLQKGDLFVALTDVRDGHDFVAQALEKGACAALVSKVPSGVSPDAPLLIVDDVLQGLEGLARFRRAQISGKVIGVTGSVGKTGTKEMLRSALVGHGNVHAAQKSFNNHWGVPLTLALMPQDTDYAVIEIGMNHPGEITPLAKLADLDVGVITTVAPVHLAAFNGVEEIAHAKAEIFDGVRPAGTVVLNADIATFPILEAKANKAGLAQITFGGANNAEFLLNEISMNTDKMNVSFSADDQIYEFQLNAVGRHLAMNSLAVLAACRAVGADIETCCADLQSWRPPAGRGVKETINIKDLGTITLVDESYNANPTSMAATLDVLAANDTGHRKVAIICDMGELGETEHQLHADLAKLDAIASIDVLHLVGPLMRSMYDTLDAGKRGLWVENVGQLVDQLPTLLQANDTVMIKGSLYMQAGKVVDAIRKMGA